ncbi:MAG: hypothetical protein KAI83_20205 [Thiomargarita sp.]|nr:hypothetical protein [Thiomargarita sp.]
MPDKEMKGMKIEMPEGMHEQFKKICAKERRSMAAMILYLIDQLIIEHNKKV